MATNTQQVWHKVLDLDELPEGRVIPKAVGVHTVCMTHFEGEYAALLNKCPHQGGPLGEGSIENGMLRCPWHAWTYDLSGGLVAMVWIRRRYRREQMARLRAGEPPDAPEFWQPSVEGEHGWQDPGR